jgi:hypothetical protein
MGCLQASNTNNEIAFTPANGNPPLADEKPQPIVVNEPASNSNQEPQVNF